MDKGNLDILIVEDDTMLNRVMTLQLEVVGLRVRSAHTGMETLNMIEKSIPSIIVLDIGLPDINGREVIEVLRGKPETADIPLVIHTTVDLSKEEQENLRLGPTRFVTKATAFSDRLAELIFELV